LPTACSKDKEFNIGADSYDQPASSASVQQEVIKAEVVSTNDLPACSSSIFHEIKVEVDSNDQPASSSTVVQEEVKMSSDDQLPTSDTQVKQDYDEAR
jgi:hypothetical protein